MNASQIKYIRTCLQIRRDQRLREYPELRYYSHHRAHDEGFGPEPEHLADARKTIKDLEASVKAQEEIIYHWYKDLARARASLRKQIEEKFQLAEESLILGGAEGDLAKILTELDAWNPEPPPAPAPAKPARGAKTGK